MMLRTLHFTCFLFFLSISLQGQQVMEAIQIRATGPCGITQTIAHDDGVFMVVKYRGILEAFGQFFGNGNQDDLILFSINHNGDILWSLEAKSNSNDDSVDLIYEPSRQELYWTGMFWDRLAIGMEEFDITIGSRGIFVSAIDANSGELDWTRILMGDSQKQVSTLSLDNFGNLYCTGYYQSTLVVNDQLTLVADRKTYLFVVKYDRSGVVVSHKNFGGDADIRPVASAYDGQSLYVAGTIKGRANFDRDTITGRLLDSDIFIFRLDANGQNPWAKLVGGVYDKFVSDLIWSNNKLYLAGHFMGEIQFRDGFTIQTNGLNFDGYIATFDQEGNALDAITISGPGTIFTTDLFKKTGELMLSGTWDGAIFNDEGVLVESEAGTRQGFVFRMSTALEKLEFTHLESRGFVSDVHFRMTMDGMDYLSLTFSEDISIGDRIWMSEGTFEGILLKFDVLSSDIPLDAAANELLIFPNPVHDRLICQGCLGLNYTIIDMQGRVVQRNSYQQDIDVGRLIAGMYILVLEDGRGSSKSLRFVKQ